MSFYTSLSGLKNAQTELNVVANNIANAETVGFKKSRVNFSDLVAGSAFTSPQLIQGIGSTVQAIAQNYSMGPIELTGGALDVAINGDGFFSTKNAATNETFYTRNGAFTVDDSGFVKDGVGNRLQIFATPGTPPAAYNPATDTQVDLQLPADNTNVPGHPTPPAAFAGVTIAKDGVVKVSYADGTNEQIGVVALAQFTAPNGLKQVGSSNWQSTGLSGQAQYGSPGEGAYGGLLSGSIERSNVDITEELVGLITAQRYFQANAKAIDTATQVSQTVLNLRT
jgi:flagellar hook protein FlgE